MMTAQEVRGCRFLADVVLADDIGGFLLPESLRNLPKSLRIVLKEFAHAYRPRLSITTIICRRGGEATITLTYDSDAVYNACLTACTRAARTWFNCVDAIDAVDVCRKECRNAADEAVRQDVEAGVRLLRDLLKRANIEYRVEAKADSGAVLKLKL
jgi:hypothetical protein